MMEDSKVLSGLPDLGGDQEGSMGHGRAFGLHAQHRSQAVTALTQGSYSGMCLSGQPSPSHGIDRVWLQVGFIHSHVYHQTSPACIPQWPQFLPTPPIGLNPPMANQCVLETLSLTAQSVGSIKM